MTSSTQGVGVGTADYCDDCNGPVFPRSRAYMAISYAAYWLWMRLPRCLVLSGAALPVLARAGDIAFACTCRAKLDAALAKARGDTRGHP